MAHLGAARTAYCVQSSIHLPATPFTLYFVFRHQTNPLRHQLSVVVLQACCQPCPQKRSGVAALYVGMCCWARVLQG